LSKRQRPRQFDHPDYLAAIRRIVAAAQSNNQPAGLMVADAKWARAYWDHGFRMLAFALDHMLFQNALRAGMDALKELG
jgi:2-keto-3-deoxy-L-rhamnonate aldolase RhmA